MKHLIRDSFIFLIYILGIVALHRSIARKRGPLVRVLTFHDVEDVVWFEKVVRMIKKKYAVITPEQFSQREFITDKINILLTFDDGYQSWIDVVLPVLSKTNLRGIFFVCSGLLDLAYDKEKTETFMKDRLFITPKKAITWDGVKTLVENGHTIGGHTVTHPDLTKLKEIELKGEILQDKQKIESALSIRLADFAYPFGTKRYYDSNAIASVKECGYLRGYTAEPGFVCDEQYKIPRMMIEKKQSVVSIKQWVLGGYDIFHLLKS